MICDTVLNGAKIYETGSCRLLAHAHTENLPYKNSYQVIPMYQINTMSEA